MTNNVESMVESREEYSSKPFTFSQLESWSPEDWSLVSRKVKLTEEFIRKFQDKVDWKEISIYQTMSEDFIIEFQDKVDWNEILVHQKVSKFFIEEFDHMIR